MLVNGSHTLVMRLLLCFAIYWGQCSALNGTTDAESWTLSGQTPPSKILSLAPLESQKIRAADIPGQVKFVLFQVHTQSRNVTLSYDDPQVSKLTPSRSYTGTSVGLAVILDVYSTEAFVWVLNPSADHDVLVLVNAALHTFDEPLPGGCNMEFPVEVSPFLRLSGNRLENTLDFQHSRLGSPRGLVAPTCDTSFFFLNYEVFAYYLKENDYSQEEYYSGVGIMSDPISIRKHANKVNPYEYGQKTRTLFMSYPGRGVIYNVIASFDKHVAAYVPIGTYNCDFNSNIDGCGKLNSLPGVLIVTCMALVGLIVTLRGHQYFNLQMVFFGFLGAAIPAFILVAKYTDLSSQERDIATLVVGTVGGIIWLLVWKILGFPVLSILVGGCLLGFLVVSTVLFTTLGNDDIFRNDINYWMIIGCGCLIIPIILLPFGVLLSVFSSAIVGSYAVIFAVDRFVGGSLAYITLNVLKRAVIDDMYKATNQVPFQGKDLVLGIIWGVLAFLGMSLQLYASMDQPQFPSRSGCSRRSVSASPAPSRRSRSRRRHRSKNIAGSNDVNRSVRRSGRVRPSAPPTERADNETQPLLYSESRATPSGSYGYRNNYEAI